MLVKKVKHRRRERGQGLVEYALILVLVAVVVIMIGAVFGESVRKTYCEAVWSVDPNIDAPACDVIDVSCSVMSSSPFRMEAIVADHVGDDDIDKVLFYVDGAYLNDEFEPKYCLVNGNGPCEPYTNSGDHTITAVAYDAEGNTGQCSIDVTVP
jgi:Flp pilus assembly pilin Flp